MNTRLRFVFSVLVLIALAAAAWFLWHYKTPAGNENLAAVVSTLSGAPVIVGLPASAPSQITITAPNAASIRYTVDGSIPTCAQGLTYSIPFTYFRPGTVRAVACDQANVASPVASASFAGAACAYTALSLARATSTQPVVQTACWDKDALFSDPQNKGFEVIRLAPAPTTADGKNYDYYPATIAYASPNVFMLHNRGPEVAGVKTYALMWSNRCNKNAQGDCVGWNTKSNLTNVDRELYAMFFTTVAKANACTLAQSLATIGAPAQKIREVLQTQSVGLETTRAGLSERHATKLDSREERLAFVGDEKLLASYEDAANNQKGAWTADVCYVAAFPGDQGAPAGPLKGIGANIAGLYMDYEVTDRRTPQQTVAFLRSLVSEVRAVRAGIPVMLGNNPIFASAVHSGITRASGPDILRTVDGVSIFVSAGLTCAERRSYADVAAQLDAQVREFNGGTGLGNLSKFVVQYDMSNDENLGHSTRKYLMERGIKKVVLQSNYIRQENCDVSDAASAKATTPVRHTMDLFNLPTPSGPTIVPSCSITASPATVSPGGDLHLSWTAEAGATRGNVRVGTTTLMANMQLPKGSTIVAAPKVPGSYIYLMSVTQSGLTRSCRQTVVVSASDEKPKLPQPPPVVGDAVTCEVTSNKTTVALGEEFFLTWKSQNAHSISGVPTQESSTPSGRQAVTLTQAGEKIYELTASNRTGGKGSCSVTVSAVSPSTPRNVTLPASAWRAGGAVLSVTSNGIFTLTAVAGANAHRMVQNFALPSPRTTSDIWKLTFEVKASTGMQAVRTMIVNPTLGSRGIFDCALAPGVSSVSNGSGGASYIVGQSTALADGWYRCNAQLKLDSAKQNSIRFIIQMKTPATAELSSVADVSAGEEVQAISGLGSHSIQLRNMRLQVSSEPMTFRVFSSLASALEAFVSALKALFSK